MFAEKLKKQLQPLSVIRRSFFISGDKSSALNNSKNQPISSLSGIISNSSRIFSSLLRSSFFIKRRLFFLIFKKVKTAEQASAATIDKHSERALPTLKNDNAARKIKKDKKAESTPSIAVDKT